MIELLHIFIISHFWIVCILSFILGFCTDAVWALWARKIDENKAVSSANFSVLIYLFGICYTLMIIEAQIVLIVLYLIGGWLGTWFSVKIGVKNG